MSGVYIVQIKYNTDVKSQEIVGGRHNCGPAGAKHAAA
jgi:hypothetical protein